ncbi:concanavalin A-like lectin/glucanase domain-containing protein, partial [Coemansia spiralis]
LPLEWSTSREKRNMSVGSDHVSIRYTGPGLQDQDAAMILTDVCIPARAGVYYFEMLIKSRGQSGYIGIGLSLAGLPSNRLPGWDVGSWGYHGDDGHIFGGDGRGTSYGPRFTTGDTVGCGIDFMRQQLFFTRNGFFLGYAFGKIDTSKDLYPCVGMRTPGEHASANFGRQPFVYDISNYLRNERQDVALNSGAIGWSDATLGLVLSYLIQSELYAAARALIKNAIGLCSASDELDKKLHKLDSQRNARKQICKYITEGEIDHALGLLQISYPRVLEDESLVFQLRCRQFIELLQADYGSSPNPIIREGLVHTFSLLAYADPAQSPIAALLDPGACEPLAHLVEMAIAASEKAPRTTSLESIAQQ